MNEFGPAFVLYTRQFRGDPLVARMTLAQVGAYLMLLLEEWEDESESLPGELAALARIARSPSLEQFERDIWPGVAPCFRVRADGRIFNRRLEEERDKQRRRKAAGRNAALRRWMR